MTWRWFISTQVRHAAAMRKHVRRILAAQVDLLSPPAIAAVSASLDELGQAIKGNVRKEDLHKQMTNVEEVANKWLKPYPHAMWRENVEVLLVALAVAMGIRTFVLQPFKIPTGSMQPTLYGVTSVPDFGGIYHSRKTQNQIISGIEENRRLRDELVIPPRWERFKQWFTGYSYVHVIAQNDGRLEEIGQPFRLLIFNIYQKLKIGGKWQTIWFPPDFGSPPFGTLDKRAGLEIDMPFRAGDTVVKMRVRAGDYLFVNRMTYNFRPPQRGEIIVFETRGIDASERAQHGVPGDQFYIKRLVALGGERVHIDPKDNHLVINGQRLSASTPNFENVYSGTNGYIGHQPVELFSGGRTVELAPDGFMVMGDNTENSLDSRYFGDFDSKTVIGKSSFVYWPLTERFGFGYR